MRLNVFNSLIGLCVATAAVSCSDGLVEDNLRPVGGESDMISFVVANENNATRGGSLGNRPCGGAILRSSDGADSLYLNMSVADITDDLSTRASQITDADQISRLNMTCVIRTINDVYTSYFENVAFNKNGSVWSSDTPYYWLENETHYKFYGYYTPGTPEDSGVEFIPGTSENKFAPSIKYTVNEDVDKQFDLSYSAPSTTENGLEYEYISSSATNPAVGLSIKHALSKIAFRTGDGMAAGTISSVSIKQVCGNGTLNLGTGDWDLSNVEKKDFSLSGLNVSGDKQDITSSNYFMLLPNTKEDANGNKTSLTDTQGAEIEVEFTPAGAQPNTPPEKYTASLKGVEWLAGKSYTYTITIKPEVGIVIEDLPEYVDAHYVIVKAHVNAENLNGKQWKLSVSTSKESSLEKATIVSKSDSKYVPLHTWYEDGYWTDNILDSKDKISGSARGVGSVTSNAAKEDIYIFIPENLEEDRDIIINATVGNNNQEIYRFKQLCPAKSNGMLIERIEEPDEISKEFIYPWGFSVDSKETIVYERKGRGSSLLGTIFEAYLAIRFWLTWSYPEYIETTNWGWGDNAWWDITIYLDKIPGLKGVAESKSDGKGNTWNIYKGGNIDFLMSVINTLKTYKFELKSGKTDITTTPVSFAALACIKKNKFNAKETTGKDEDGVPMYDVTIDEGDVFWYLPAEDQAKNIKDAVKDLRDPLENEVYWTSTAVKNSGEMSVVFNEDGTDNRKIRHRVRACRDKPKN